MGGWKGQMRAEIVMEAAEPSLPKSVAVAQSGIPKEIEMMDRLEVGREEVYEDEMLMSL